MQNGYARRQLSTDTAHSGTRENMMRQRRNDTTVVPVSRRNRVTPVSRPRDFPNVRKRPGYYLKGPAAARGARQIISDNLPAAVKPYRPGLRSVIVAGYRESRHDSSSFFVQLRARRQAVIKSRGRKLSYSTGVVRERPAELDGNRNYFERSREIIHIPVIRRHWV